MRVWTALSVVVAAASSVTPAHAQATPLKPTVSPELFRSTVFATGLNFPYGMVELADG
jgi:hypothetical protein